MLTARRLVLPQWERPHKVGDNIEKKWMSVWRAMDERIGAGGAPRACGERGQECGQGEGGRRNGERSPAPAPTQKPEGAAMQSNDSMKAK